MTKWVERILLPFRNMFLANESIVQESSQNHLVTQSADVQCDA
jgi:hypothetical protein